MTPKKPQDNAGEHTIATTPKVPKPEVAGGAVRLPTPKPGERTVYGE